MAAGVDGERGAARLRAEAVLVRPDLLVAGEVPVRAHPPGGSADRLRLSYP